MANLLAPLGDIIREGDFCPSCGQVVNYYENHPVYRNALFHEECLYKLWIECYGQPPEEDEA